MKKKKLTTPKIIGLALMLFAFISMVLAIPLVSYIKSSGETTVIVATQDLAENTIITQSMVKKVQTPKSELLIQFNLSIDEIIGQYTSTFIGADEPISKTRLSKSPIYKDYYLNELPEGKQAISVTLANMAASVSGKVQPNDIVTVYACPPSSETGNMAVQPKELQYVKVLDVVTTEGESLADKSEATPPQLSTITLLVDARQASILAYYDKAAPVHLSVVYRGSTQKADTYLEKQAEELKAILEQELDEATKSEIERAEAYEH